MQTLLEILIPIVVLVGIGGAFFVRTTRRRPTPTSMSPSRPTLVKRAAPTAQAPAAPAATEPETAESVLEPELTETPEPAAGRLIRLRARLARSESTLGRGLLALLSRDTLDDETWQEVEDLLLTADVGVGATTELVDSLKTKAKVLGTRSADDARALLREGLIELVDPGLDRTLATRRGRAKVRPSSWSSASTAPARPPPAARSPGCSSPRAEPLCSARPTRFGPPPPTSSKRGDAE